MSSLPHTTPTHAGDFTFLATREYFAQLITDIHHAKKGDRVLLASMNFESDEPVIQELVHALTQAALRGVQTTLEVDAFNFLAGKYWRPGPLFWRTTLPQTMHGSFGRTYDILHALQKSGVAIVVTNIPTKPLTPPMTGRSHIKISVINDTVYIGGCNLGDMHLDMMVCWQDNTDATWLYNLMRRRIDNPRTLAAFGTHDLHRQVAHNSQIIVDVGVKHQSAIYEQAFAVIDAAEEWLVITCQFFPNSTTALHLKRAQARGVKVYPIFNHYSAHSIINQPLQHAVTLRERMRMPASFFETELPPGTTYLHAKLIATEKEALIGSHNYVPAGVNFGTAEIALHNKTAAFSRAAAQLIVQETGLASRPAFAFLFD